MASRLTGAAILLEAWGLDGKRPESWSFRPAEALKGVAKVSKEVAQVEAERVNHRVIECKDAGILEDVAMCLFKGMSVSIRRARDIGYAQLVPEMQKRLIVCRNFVSGQLPCLFETMVRLEKFYEDH